jgi:hypothetical protein
MKAARKARQSVFGGLGRSEFVERRIAGAMRFVFKWSQAVGRERATRTAAGVSRRLSRFSRENELAKANIAAAYPEKSQEERDRILAGVWENLGRQSVEYAFLQDLVEGFDPAHPNDGPVEAVGLEHVYALRDSGKPAILFGAHIGSFELTPARAARPAGHRTLPAADQSPHRRRDRETPEQLSRPHGGVRPRRRARGGGRAEEGTPHRRARRPADFRRSDHVLQPASLSNPIVGVMARIFDCPVHGGAPCSAMAASVVMTPPPTCRAMRAQCHLAPISSSTAWSSLDQRVPRAVALLHDRWHGAGRAARGQGQGLTVAPNRRLPSGRDSCHVQDVHGPRGHRPGRRAAVEALGDPARRRPAAAHAASPSSPSCRPRTWSARLSGRRLDRGKSSIEDFRVDRKWPDYRCSCDRLFFATHAGVPAGIFPGEAGLILADAYGAEFLREAPEHRLAAATRKAMLVRFAQAAAHRLLGLVDPAAGMPDW